MADNPSPHDITVMYVEDEAGTRDQVGRMLGSYGYRLLMAEDGREGVELFRRHRPDITLTDIMMPVMNGLEMARTIREEAPDAQIIVMTAFSDTNYLLDAIDIGINQFIVKPVEFNKLQSAIQRCITMIGMQRRIQEQTERIRMLSNALEQSPSMALITDTQGAIEYVNHKFCEVTGFAADEVMGKTPRILQSGETPPDVYRDLWTTILGGHEWHGVLKNRGKTGDFFWEYSSISPLTSADGTITKFIKTAEDITERRKLEAEAHRVKKLEATAMLAGGMAHDFNNLLQVILGNISLAKQRAEPGSIVHSLLDIAEQSSGHARDLSQRLLTFAKGGDISMHAAPLDRLIRSGVETALNGTAIDCELDLPPDIPVVNIDEMQIQQVITHLTVNALEAMPDGGELRVAASACTVSEGNESSLPPGEYVHLTFSDSGRGIQPENLGRIFDPYFTTKQMGSKKGLGLGLAVCHAIIRKHNGMITAESQPGEGTTIHIYLPSAQKNVLSTAYTSSTT